MDYNQLLQSTSGLIRSVGQGLDDLGQAGDSLSIYFDHMDRAIKELAKVNGASIQSVRQVLRGCVIIGE